MVMVNCIFCEIAARRSPSHIVAEYATSLAFTPLSPVGPGHTLLIPLQHFETIFDIPVPTLQQLIGDAKTLAHQLIHGTDFTGVNLLHASGRDAQQSVPHFHLHLVPRRPNDGLDLWIRSGL